jgi:pimeloyl-ACP methyl ester carboxylesterase
MQAQKKTDGVVLLHGIFHSPYGMRGLATFLKNSGFEVLNLGYPSTQYTIQQLADIIHEKIAPFVASISGKIHFVGYSMGGLVIRAYMKKYKPSNLGRVVMIGTPNKGSEVADFLRNFKIYQKLYGPAGQQLITDQEKFKHIFAETDFEIGSIAGNKDYYFISDRLIGKPNDGQVSIESTQLDNLKDHIVLPCNHFFFPFDKTMWNQVVHFLEFGQFSH